MPQNKVTANQISNYSPIDFDFSSLYATTITTTIIISTNILRIRKIKKIFNI